MRFESCNNSTEVNFIFYLPPVLSRKTREVTIRTNKKYNIQIATIVLLVY